MHRVILGASDILRETNRCANAMTATTNRD